MANRKLGKLGKLGIFFPSFLLSSFRFWVLGQNRNVDEKKSETKFQALQAFRGFRAFDLAELLLSKTVFLSKLRILTRGDMTEF